MNENIIKLMHSLQLEELSYLVVCACLYHQEHPVTSIRRAFANTDNTLSFLDGVMPRDDYMGVLQVHNNNMQDDSELRGIVWSLLLYVLSFCELYGYDVREVDTVLDKHLGWEYIACIWRDICREEAPCGARMINDFINNH